MDFTLLKITALLSLIPASVLTFRRTPQKDMVFWSAVAVALFGTIVWVYIRQSAGWHTGLSTALWLTVASCLIVYVVIALFTDDGWRLTAILFPYLLILGILAVVWSQVPEQPFVGNAPLAWIGTHIAVSVATYAMITLAAVAALAATLQERAIKSKKRTRVSQLLPSVAGSEGLLVRLLIASEVVLAIGLITGMATLYMTTGQFLIFDHKTTLTMLVFVIVGVILFIHFRSGIRGRFATRIVLLAYLLLTLGYPGVKFVTDILLAS
ncbi:MAG: cytochrome c biogenesis protein CcsA [Rhodospirillaceae bacterium]|jgi:ABC-type uncharacterized transport system permease subunit|nr:cytochrome c biogenesis protein CcsA [Rhodospirillaceae bacterium]MBT4588185.1 cytochrome c biogenesis protein CcsA [Rhodospirillaceae bacterium]MBT5939078.1 cytochrome c biogenesis protein CcsA [Rhodospirillaceae bacterium]MBT7267008.1 cytochrome c biogenesis protein CcsA [Rhodospirillaceae bacterium]